MPRSVKKTLNFYNNTGSLEIGIEFLEKIRKKVTYLNLKAEIEGNKIKVIIFGPRDLQYLAIETIRDIAKILE